MTNYESADVFWHTTGQTREGYACGSVCAGGKSRAFHLAAVSSDFNIQSCLDKQAGAAEMIPEGDRPLLLNSKRLPFQAYPAEDKRYISVT